MAIQISTVSNNQSFSTLIERFRQMTEITSANTVTADATADGSLTNGNVQVRGNLLGNTLIANGSIRGGNNSSSNVLIISSNAIFTTPSGANVLVVYSNTLFSNVFLVPSNITVNPSGNTLLSGPVLNINAVSTNITSVNLNGNTYFTQTGPLVIRANGSVTLASFITNTAIISATNTTIFGANLYVTANSTLTGRLNVTGNSAFTNAVVTSTLSVNTLTITSGSVTLPNTTVASLTTGRLTASGNVAISANGANVFIIDTTGLKASFGNIVMDPSSTITVNGTITADTFRFPDGATVPRPDGISTILAGTSSVAVTGSNQVVITAAGQTIGIIDRSANSYNFFGATVRANTFVANVSIVTPTINSPVIATQTVTINALAHSIATKLITANADVQTVDTMVATSNRCVDWTVVIEDASTSSYQMSKLMSVHDGSSTQTTEYAILTTNNSLGTLTTDLTGGQLRLRLTPTTFPLTIRLSRLAITTA